MKHDGDSYHRLMIDLNDFISSMDFLTAVRQGLMERQRNVTISCCCCCCSITQLSPWNIRHEYAVIKNIPTWEHKEVHTYTFCCPSDDMQTIVCWLDIHALWEVNTAVSIYLYQEFMCVVWRKGKFVCVRDKQRWMTRFQGFTFQTHAV